MTASARIQRRRHAAFAYASTPNWVWSYDDKLLNVLSAIFLALRRWATAAMTRHGSLWSSAAGCDDLRLPAGPVIHDLLAGNGKRIVWVDIVEVSEAQHDVIKRLIGELGLETLKE